MSATMKIPQIFKLSNTETKTILKNLKNELFEYLNEYLSINILS